jgi:hypothetical protein
VLLAPALLAYIGLIDRRAFRDRRPVLKALLLLLLPLLLYLYLPLRAPQTPYLRLPLTEGRDLVLYENTLASLVGFVLGGPFGGSIDLSVDLGERLAMAWGFLRGEVRWIGLILALVGVIQLAVGRLAPGPHAGQSGPGRGHRALLALTGLAYVTSVAFNLVYTIGDIYVLYVPTYLIVVLWMAVGVGALAALAGRRRLASALIVLPFFALPLWMVTSQYADLDQIQNTRARMRWEAILAEPLPANAVLVSNDRNNIMPMWYFQYVDGRQPGWLGLFPLITPEVPSLAQVLDLALGTGRPVYLIKEMPGVEVKVNIEPEGRLWRVLGPAAGEEPVYRLDVRLADALTLLGHDRSPHSPQPGETLQVSLYWEALRPLAEEYHTFVHLLDGEGQWVAQSDRQPGGVYYPTTLWQTGERLRDDHLLTIPPGTPDGVYNLLAGAYAFASDGTLEPLGDPVVAGHVGIKSKVQTEPGDVGHPTSANFADRMELIGYDWSSAEGTLTVTLHWHCLHPPGGDYTVFAHLLDGNGNVVTQSDGQPQGGTYPTSVWNTGEVVADKRLLSLPSGLPAGDYRLRVGLYLLETGERLPVEGGGDSVELELKGME